MHPAPVREPPAARARLSPGLQTRADESRIDAISRAVSRISLWSLVFLGVFGIGIHFANEKYWPYQPIDRAWTVLTEALEFGGFAPENAVGEAPEHAAREEWKVHDAEGLNPGYRAVLGYLGEVDEFGIWIFDKNGEKVHERILNYHALDPDGPSGGSEAPHAFHFMPDGSVVVNSDKGDVMARYDTCGEAMWSREGSFHHSFTEAPNGDLWTWSGEVSAFDQYQYLVRIDPETGETRERIALIEDVLSRTPEASTVFTTVPGYEYRHYDGPRGVPDKFHPNDLEVLTPEMAAAFPMFEAGDMLMSFRNIDLVTVMDPETYELKWWSHGPWIQQHDPDFTADGEISVYNNNGRRGVSSIMVIDPETRAVRNVELDDDYRFYTGYMGKHEYLDDGTLAVVVPFEGRVLEFAPEGSLKLEINNLYNEANNAIISDYVWLPEDYFDTQPSDFDCNNGQPT